MSPIDVFIGVSFIFSGLLFAAFAQPLFAVIDLESIRAKRILGTIRLTTGLGLILVAPVLRSSGLFRVLGAVTFLGGIAFVLIAHETWIRFVRWWTREHPTLYRVVTVTVLTLLGGIIVCSAL